MKTFNIFKVICCVALTLLASESLLKTEAVESVLKTGSAESVQSFKDDNALVDDALGNMYELFESEGGNPTKASCLYELKEDTPIKRTTKVYYTTTYHKKPLHFPKMFQDKMESNRTIKITFKKNDSTVELFEKGSRGKRRVEIEIPVTFQI